MRTCRQHSLSCYRHEILGLNSFSSSGLFRPTAAPIPPSRSLTRSFAPASMSKDQQHQNGVQHVFSAGAREGGFGSLVPHAAQGSDVTPSTSLSAVPDTNRNGVGDRRLTLLHFNDVYNIEAGPREPVGGAARFAQKVKSLSDKNPLIVFSGDAFNPSLLSTFTLGEQMPPVLNEIGVSVACIGNHDFDFGTTQLRKLVKMCNFPWLMANVLDKETGKPYAKAPATYLMDWNGVKVGFAGLVESEWLETLGAVNASDLDYVDFVEEGRRLAKQLKDAGAEVLVAITHMRLPNDILLATEVPEFDIVMGGHDHDYGTFFVEDVLVVKSGTDFRELTQVEVTLPACGGRPKSSWIRHTIEASLPQCPVVEKIVDSYMSTMAAKMAEVIGHTSVELDGRFSTVRSKESNLGNFICDVVKLATKADAVLINGGTFRSDTIHPTGEFTLGVLSSILPMMDGSVVMEVTGQQLLMGLENSVSQYPKLEGRFAQVSGIRFTFDPSLPSDSRVLVESVTVGGKPLILTTKYSLATKTYAAEGKDGYDMFADCRILVDEESGVQLPTVIRNHFRYLAALNFWDPRARAQRFAHKWADRVLRRQAAAVDSQGGAGGPPALRPEPQSIPQTASDAGCSVLNNPAVEAQGGAGGPPALRPETQPIPPPASDTRPSVLNKPAVEAQGGASGGGGGTSGSGSDSDSDSDIYLPHRTADMPEEDEVSKVGNLYSIKPRLDGRIRILTPSDD